MGPQSVQQFREIEPRNISHHFQQCVTINSGESMIFLRGNTNTQSRCANLLFCKFFAENYMKMKEFGLRRGCVSLAPPLDLPMVNSVSCVLRYRSRCQDDIFPRIELIPSFVLSSDNTNCKNDIQLFHQLFDELSVHTDYH